MSHQVTQQDRSDCDPALINLREWGLRALRVAVAFVLVLGPAACGSTKDAAEGAGSTGSVVMPNVTGQQLDIAENSIKSAGFDGDAQVVGGGTFGVLDKSNWQVCKQSPADGQPVTAAPQLTVDRSCGGSASGSATSPATSASGEQPSEKPAQEKTESDATLTARNNKDLAALLRVKDPADPRVAAFANKYLNRIIEFDGNVASVLPHGDTKTLEDVLINAGDYYPNAAIGPDFRLSGVSMYDIPDGGHVGDNIRIKATIGEYDSEKELFELDPVPVTITARN